jgi:Family of unknown function (DUF5335)
MPTETQQIPRETWQEYFDRLSTVIGTVEATVEITGPDVGDQFISEDPLVVTGMTYDEKDDVLVIGLDVPGGHVEELEHFVYRPQAILAAGPQDLETELVLDIQDDENHQTIVRIQPVPALPGE